MSQTRRDILTSGGVLTAGLATTGTVAGQSQTGRPDPDVPDAQILGDVESEPVEIVEYDSEMATVCRYHNIADDAATGIEVYVDGTRLLEESAVDPRLEDAAWVRALDAIRDDDGSGLSEKAEQLSGEVLDRTRLISGTLDGPGEVLETIISGIETLQGIGVSIGGQSYTIWDAATAKFPFLDTFEDVIRQANNRIQGWLEVAETVNDDVPPFVSDLEDLPPPRRPPTERFRSRAEDASNALESLASHTRNLMDDIRGLRDEASRVIEERARLPVEIMDQLGVNAGDGAAGAVRDQVDEFVDGLVELANQILEDIVEPVLDPLESFRQLAIDANQELDVAGSATEIDEGFTQEWGQRRRGERLVVAGGSMGAGGLALLLLVGWIRRDPEVINDE